MFGGSEREVCSLKEEEEGGVENIFKWGFFGHFFKG